MKRILVHIILIVIAAACHMELPQQPVAKFTFDPPAGCQAPCSITFTSQSANAASLQWDFNDGSPAKSGNPVTHEFKSGKDYEVKLIVRGTDGGSHGATQTVKITTAPSAVPVALFNYTITNDSIAPAIVTFSNQSTDANRYEWDFGDPAATVSNPNTSSQKDPAHTYTNPGRYEITLTVYNDNIPSAPLKKTILIKAQIGSVHAFSMSGDYNFPTGVITDEVGNIYVSGVFRGTANFGNGNVRSSRSGSDDFYVVKYSPSWQCLWVYWDGSTANDHVNDLVLDSDGYLYVTGFVNGSIQGGGVTPRGGADGFVVKLNPLTGRAQWISTFGGPGEDQGRALAFHQTPTGPRLYLGATVVGDGKTKNITFNTTQYSANQKDFCFAWLNPANGEITQSVLMGGPGQQTIEGLAVDGVGNVYMTGGFENTFSFPSVARSLTSLGRSDAYVAKWILGTQQFHWSIQAGSTTDDFAYDIVTDRQNNVFVTGTHTGQVPELGIGSRGDENVFVGKWDVNGISLEGQNGFNDGKPDFAGGIAITAAGNILISGSYSVEGRFSFFSTDYLPAVGSMDIIICEIDPNTLIPTRKFQTSDGGIGLNRAVKICATADGYVYSVGQFTGNATYNDITLFGNAAAPNTYIVRHKL